MPLVRLIVHYHHLKPLYSICGLLKSCLTALYTSTFHLGPLHFIFLLLHNKYLRSLVAVNHGESKISVKNSSLFVV